MFSIIGSLNAAWAFTLWERPWACRLSEALIESRQFIGWWRDAVSDALTSSAYTGERAICSSEFSTFTKWPYCPSVAIFLAQYNFSDMDSPFALRRLHTAELCSPCGEVPWNIAVVNHRVLDLSPAMTRTLSVLNVWCFRMHARRFMGFQNVHFVRISVSEPSALGLRCSKRSHPFFPVVPQRPSRPPLSPQPVVRMFELEAMESEQTGLAFSLPPCARKFTGWIRAWLFVT